MKIIETIKRLRWWVLLGLPLVAILLNATGADGWREPWVKIVALSWAALALTAAYVGRRALFDYARGGEAWRKAIESPTGAGLAFLGLCILTGLLFIGFAGFARAENLRNFASSQNLPPNAQLYLPLLQQEIDTYWPEHPLPSVLGALIEQETCYSLTHSKCWSPAARLKTSREEGAGLGQLTRAWWPDGSLRFDTLSDLRTRHAGLSELSWATIYERADLQLRAAVLMNRECFRTMAPTATDWHRLAFCDAAYNGGRSGVQQERHICKLTDGCDPDQWFGNVEHHCLKSKALIPGTRQNGCDINRAHVQNVMVVRRTKYVPILDGVGL